jgi:soluble lytic murein transglycosylase-like protein
MRAILALAILLVSLKAAVPETNYQDELSGNGENLAVPNISFNLETAAGQARQQTVLALLPAQADAPHRQGEDAADFPQSPPPAVSDVEADQAPPDSIDALCKALLASAVENDLPVPFFANLIWQESRFQHDAVSSAGALGIAQFMPEVAIEVGLGDPFDPHEAIPASAKFLHTLREQFGNVGFAAAAYNAGAHRVTEWLEHKKTLPRETQIYVVRVTGRSAEAWRKAPQNDSQLTFVRPLPCRGLPAFAELEQAQLHEAQEAQQQQPQSHQEKGEPAGPKAVKDRPARPAARRFRPALVAKHTGPEQRLAVVSHAASIDHVARNFRGEKLEAAHKQHSPHEKRRMA